MPRTHPTKQRLLDAGLAMLLEHGYNDLGIQALLAATGTPKGSFYHHFKDKAEIAERLAVSLEQARKRGDIPADSNAPRMASLLVDCWEGAALRSRLRGNAAPLTAMLDFSFQSVNSEVNGAERAASRPRARGRQHRAMASPDGSE